MAQEIELSIAETNKLRAQLGLPLIPDPEETPGNKENAPSTGLSSENANRLRMSLGLRPKESVEELAENKKNRNSIENENDKKLKERPAYRKKPIAGFLYDDIESTDSWLANLGKKSKISQQNTETHPSIDGDSKLKLAHDADLLSELRDGDVLTLEDGGIIDEHEDAVLANENLKIKAKDASNKLEREKEALLKYGVKPSYGDVAKERLVGAIIKGNQVVMDSINRKEEGSIPKQNAQRFKLDFDDLKERKAPVTMKKIKNKSKNQSKKRLRDDDESIEVSGPMVTASLDVGENNDDELELMLAKSRRNKQKQRNLLTAEEIAEEVKLHLRVDTVSIMGDGFVYDDTKDFFDSIQAPFKSSKVQGVEADENPPVKSDDSLKNSVAIINTEEEEHTEPITVEEATLQGHEGQEEQYSAPLFNSLLDTLKYIRQQNQQTPKQDPQSDKLHRQAYREAELNKIKISIEERVVREELEKDQSYISMPKEEKEKLFDRVLNNRLVDKGIISELSNQKYSRYNKKTDTLSSYSPQVKLRYTDNTGQVLNTKQAWKQLLHQYHGLEPKHKKKKLLRKESKEIVLG